jgi:acetyl esterase/lipase
MNLMIIDVYKAMMQAHPDEEIVFLGDSSGANLALVACHYNKTLRNPLPMPKTLILLAPALASEDDPAIVAAMEKIAPYDVMLSLQLLQSLKTLFDVDFSKDNTFASPLYGDFTDFPPVHIFAGTRDIFYPLAAPFVRRLKDAGVDAELIEGQDMMHVWPYVPVAPEAKKALKHIIEIIKGDL